MDGNVNALLDDSEQLVTCVYNPAHQVRKNRLPKHQNDCRKQNPNANVSRCRFNSAHHIPNEDLTRHESECESRVAYEQILAGNYN